MGLISDPTGVLNRMKPRQLASLSSTSHRVDPIPTGSRKARHECATNLLRRRTFARRRPRSAKLGFRGDKSWFEATGAKPSRRKSSVLNMRTGTEILTKLLKSGACPLPRCANMRKFSASTSNGDGKWSNGSGGGDATLEEYSDVVVCPLSKEPLKIFQDGKELFSESINAAFPVEDGIPCLVPLLGRIVNVEPDEGN